MERVRHIVTLQSEEGFSEGAPPRVCAKVIKQIQDTLALAVRIALDGTGNAPKGRSRLQRAQDVRLLDVQTGERVTFLFDAPRLGDAAVEVYGQAEFWPTRPDAQWTAFDVLAEFLDGIRHGDVHCDPSILQRVARFGDSLRPPLRSLHLESFRGGVSASVAVDATLVEAAQKLGDATPETRWMRLVGRLDMIRVSTGRFSISLEDGTEISAALVQGDVSLLRQLLDRQVVVEGRAVFRPPLEAPASAPFRMDAEHVDLAETQPSLFTRLPEALAPQFPFDQKRPLPLSKGLDPLLGSWPGDESERELLELLYAIR